MTSSVHLPTEVVVLCFLFIAADDRLPLSRQRSLHACCLVSRQWYSAAIAFLYEKPQVGSGLAFGKFTETVCPPVAARKSKWNLGAFVRQLDLSGLVHHSSNSLTARLLGRVKENLEVFIAPRISFASNSLPALSKCLNLSHLDLSLVSDPIPFPQLKKAIHNLRHLVSLRLPRSTFLNNPESPASPTIDWPPRLQSLQLSGTFSPPTIPSFAWPPRLIDLSLTECTDLSVTAVASLLCSPQLAASLKRLSISPFNRNLQPESVNAVPAFLPALQFLSVPGDLVEDSFFDILAHMVQPLELEVLELVHPLARRDGTLCFSTVTLLEALGAGLANLRAVGFANVFCTEERILEDEDIDDILQKRGASTASGLVVDAGVYYM